MKSVYDFHSLFWTFIYLLVVVIFTIKGWNDLNLLGIPIFAIIFLFPIFLLWTLTSGKKW